MHAFLQVVAGSREGLNLRIAEGETLVVGRKKGDLLLADPLVSSRHCQISMQGGRFFLKDLGSTNGTTVDGRLVRDATLSPGSEISIGTNRMILYVGEDPPEADAPRPTTGPEIAWLLDEELVEIPGPAEKTRTGLDVIGQDLRLPPGVNAAIEVVAGQDAGRVFRFTRGSVSIGRRLGDVPLNDVEVSRRQAVVELFGRDMIFLRDLASTNGTYHNGRRVSVSRLRDGDTIGCGKTVMKIRLTR